MDVRSALSAVGLLFLGVVGVSLLIGGVVGQPVLLSYVDSGSMQPTLDPGDGFIAVPSEFAGPIERGDVITFRAERLNDGGLVTHRVVRTTERGYVTKGDANTFTDQSGEEPPVKDAQVLAVAFETNGDVVVIPHLGTAIIAIQDGLSAFQGALAETLGTGIFLGVQGLAYLLFCLSVVLYVVDVWRERGQKSRSRRRGRDSGTSARLLILGFTAVVVVAATMSMTVPAGTQKFDVVSAEFDSQGPRVIPAGESETTTYTLGNAGVVPVVVFLEPASEGIDVRPRETRLDGLSVTNASVTLSAPPETGHYRRFLVHHRYLAILPTDAIRAMYHVHPWLPILAIDLAIAVPFYLLGVTLVGTGRVRTRSREGPSFVRRAVNRYR